MEGELKGGIFVAAGQSGGKNELLKRGLEEGGVSLYLDRWPKWGACKAGAGGGPKRAYLGGASFGPRPLITQPLAFDSTGGQEAGIGGGNFFCLLLFVCFFYCCIYD